MDVSTPQATRRNLLALAAVGGAVLSAGQASAARRLDFADPADRLKAYILMRGALDDRLVIGFVSGVYYGVVDDDIKPLFGVLGATFSRYRALPDGTYEVVSYETPFFNDLETGDYLVNWTNPYTGEEAAVGQSPLPPNRVIIGKDLAMGAPHMPPGMIMQDRVLPVQIVGDDVWMTQETRTAVQIPNLPKPVHYSELTTVRAKRAALETPGAKSVPCQTAFTAVVSWRPWMKMAGHPGHLMASGVGAYGVALDQLPAAWLKIARERRPDVLKNPGAPLEPLWNAKR